MFKKMTAVLLVVMMLVPSLGLAQGLPTAGEATGAADAGAAKAQKVKTIDIEDGEDFEGNLLRPGEQFKGEQHGKTSSLMQVRGDFVDKLLRTADKI